MILFIPTPCTGCTSYTVQTELHLHAILHYSTTYTLNVYSSIFSWLCINTQHFCCIEYDDSKVSRVSHLLYKNIFVWIFVSDITQDCECESVTHRRISFRVKKVQSCKHTHTEGVRGGSAFTASVSPTGYRGRQELSQSATGETCCPASILFYSILFYSSSP